MGDPDRNPDLPTRPARIKLSGLRKSRKARSLRAKNPVALLPGRQRFKHRLKKHLRGALRSKRSLAFIVLSVLLRGALNRLENRG